MSIPEAKQAFQELLYNQPPYFGNMPKKFTAQEFSEQMLGLGPLEDQ